MLIPSSSQWKILWLDIERMCVKEDEEISSLVEEKLGEFCLDLFGSFRVGEKIYMSFYGSSLMGILDVNKKEILWKTFDGYVLANAQKVDEDIWIITLDETVIRCSENKEQVYKYLATKERSYYYVLN